MDTDILTQILQRMLDQFTENLPAIITVLLIIIIGWGVARLVAALAKRFVIRTGLNQAFSRSVIAMEWDKIQPGRTLADIAAIVIFWLLWLSIIFSALTTSDLNLETTALAGILHFLPRLFAAFLILVGGVLLAQFIGRWVQVGVAATGVEYHEAFGRASRLVLIVIVVITAIETLGIDLTLLRNALTNLLTIIIAGVALAFGFGGREVVRNILAGYYAREHFELGDHVQIDGEIGTLDAIGAVSAEISIADGQVVIPNSDLTDKKVKKFKSG